MGGITFPLIFNYPAHLNYLPSCILFVYILHKHIHIIAFSMYRTYCRDFGCVEGNFLAKLLPGHTIKFIHFCVCHTHIIAATQTVTNKLKGCRTQLLNGKFYSKQKYFLQFVFSVQCGAVECEQGLLHHHRTYTASLRSLAWRCRYCCCCKLLLNIIQFVSSNSLLHILFYFSRSLNIFCIFACSYESFCFASECSYACTKFPSGRERVTVPGMRTNSLFIILLVVEF